MPIQVGERLPQVTFRVMTSDGPVAKITDDLFKGRKVVLVAVPGAFTPTCHRNHLPGYVQKKDEILAKGVDAILVTSVNDVFVLEAWGKASEAEGIEFLSDGNADFAKAIGLSMDGAGSALAHSVTPWWSKTAWCRRSTWRMLPPRPSIPAPRTS
jgi:peroxiredoxin